MLKWRKEEQQFRVWYAWVMEGNQQVWETDRWMDEVAKFHRLLVERDVKCRVAQQQALQRMQRAHFFYPNETLLHADVQVRHNFVTAGIETGDFADVTVHTATGEAVSLSRALDQTGSKRVLVVAGSSS